MRNRHRRNRQPAQGGRTERGGDIIVHTGDAPESRRTRVDDGEVNSFVMRLMGRFGTAENALLHIAGEQLKYRRRAQDAEEHAKELQELIPGKGDIVLKGDKAKEYQTVVLDGKVDLTKVPDQLKELNGLQTTRGQESRQADIARAADPEGNVAQGGEGKYKVKVLERLLGDLPLEFKKKNVRDEDAEEGFREISEAFVKLPSGTVEALDTWLEREHKDFWDIVQVDPEGGDGDEPEDSAPRERRPAPTLRREEPRVPNQRPAASGGRKKGSGNDILSMVDKTLGAQYQLPSKRAEAAKK